MEDMIRVEMEMEQKMCNTCKKSSSEYYELELHLRFKGFDDIIKLKGECIKLLESNFNSINKLEEVDNGFDVKFISKGEMNKLSSIFSNKYFIVEKRSSKLVGRNNLTSKDIYRYNISIVIHNIKVGNEVIVKGEKFRIKAINKGNILVLNDLITGRKKVVSYSIVEDYFEKIE